MAADINEYLIGRSSATRPHILQALAKQEKQGVQVMD